MIMTRKLQFLLTALLLMVGVTSAWAGDFIDDATSITIKHSGAADASSITPETESGKKVLKFTPTTTNDAYIEFTFSSGRSITPGQAFAIIEITNGATTANHNRIFNLTIGTTDLEEGSAGSIQSTTEDGKTVILCNFLQNAHGTESKSMPKYYADNVDNASFTMKKMGMYVAIGTASTEVVISHVEFYTLGAALKKYSTFCTSKDWQYVKIATPRVEVNGSGGNTIKIKDESGGAATENQYKLFMKTLDLTNLPSAYTTLNFGNLRPSFSTTVDLFTNTTIGTRNLKLSHKAMHKLPTINSRLTDSEGNTSWYRFMDGNTGSTTAPKDVTFVKTGDGSANWGTYTRELKSGYNTVLMPFKKLAGADYQSSDLTFYKVSSYSAGTATFEKVTNTYSNNTFITDIKDGDVITGYAFNPFIIYTEKPGLYTFVGRDVVTPATYYTGYKEKRFGSTSLYMVGTFEDECPMGSGKDYESYICFGITNDGTYVKKMNTDTKASYYRAFMVYKGGSLSAPMLNISFDNLDGTTDIISIRDVDGMNRKSNDDAIYNLHGVRMNGENLPKGIYVKNGRKFIVK